MKNNWEIIWWFRIKYVPLHRETKPLTNMEKKELQKIKDELIAEILGIVKTKGYYDTDRDVYYLYCCNGVRDMAIACWFGNKAYCCEVECVRVKDGNVFVCTDTGISEANILYIDDLLLIKDYIAKMNDEHIAQCKNYFDIMLNPRP